jgi:hypothetical protein
MIQPARKLTRPPSKASADSVERNGNGLGTTQAHGWGLAVFGCLCLFASCSQASDDKPKTAEIWSLNRDGRGKSGKNLCRHTATVLQPGWDAMVRKGTRTCSKYAKKYVAKTKTGTQRYAPGRAGPNS